MLNILIITDDAVLLAVLLKSLAIHIPEARVDSHQIAATGVNQIYFRKYHIVMIDTHLTPLDNLVSLSQNLDLQPNASIIFVAEREAHELIVNALQGGAYDFVTRPIDQVLFIASLKRAAERVRLFELNRFKDAFLSGISHALRSPLNSILNCAKLVRTDNLGQPTSIRAVEIIERAIKEQAKLLERIDDLPHTITAGLRIPFEPNEMKALVTQLLETDHSDFLTGMEETSYSRSNGGPLNGLKILVVDDEADGRELLHIMLSQYGATVVAVESVKEALSTMHEFLPDILVSDIGMPVQDGYALISQIRSLESGKRVAALALTAYASSDDYNKTMAAGFDAYLCKPVEPTNLVRTLGRLAARTEENHKG